MLAATVRQTCRRAIQINQRIATKLIIAYEISPLFWVDSRRILCMKEIGRCGKFKS